MSLLNCRAGFRHRVASVSCILIIDNFCAFMYCYSTAPARTLNESPSKNDTRSSDGFGRMVGKSFKGLMDSLTSKPASRQ